MTDAGSTGGSGNNRDEVTEVADSTLNRVFDVLASQRCRYTVYALRDAEDDVMGITTLAVAVCTRDPIAMDQDTVELDLHHKTLPRLAEANIIDYDARTKTVRYHGDDLLDTVLTTI